MLLNELNKQLAPHLVHRPAIDAAARARKPRQIKVLLRCQMHRYNSYLVWHWCKQALSRALAHSYPGAAGTNRGLDATRPAGPADGARPSQHVVHKHVGHHLADLS